MTDDAGIRQQAVAAIVKGVARKSAVIVLTGCAAALAYSVLRPADGRWWLLPVSVLFGGVLGLVNFRWLAAAVQRIYLRQGATPGVANFAAVIISLLKLSAIFVVLFIVIKGNLLNIFGVVAGLSLCFLAILWEGLTMMNQTLKSGMK